MLELLLQPVVLLRISSSETNTITVKDRNEIHTWTWQSQRRADKLAPKAKLFRLS